MGTVSETIRASAPPTDLLRRASLFLDFDGTLVEIAATPGAVVVGARLRALLPRLARAMDGRLAIVSGRPIAQIAAYFPDLDVAMSGSHGLELRHAGTRHAAPVAAGWIADAVARAAPLIAAHPGVLVEDKPFGVAVHYRAAPDAEMDCRIFAEMVAGGKRHLQPGKMVFEVREAGGDKGGAVRALMAAPGMADTRPIFIGDDLTDEPAFAAAVGLGGAGILVGAERASAAAYRLDGVGETIAWLEAAAQAKETA